MNDNEPMVDFLQKYIQIETVFPEPRYTEAIDLLIRQAMLDGFKIQKLKLASGFPALIITFEGSEPSLPSLVLNHHMDVVPAPYTAEWVAPPFAGEMRDGILIGRGTQDMKGVGVIQYFALKALKDSGMQPQRTIHLIAVPDEERGGRGGTNLLIHTEEFKKLAVGYVIDEGCPSGAVSSLYIKIDERKPLQIRLTAHGERAHGSKLSAQNASHDLVKALHDIVTYQSEQQGRLPSAEPGSLLSMNITSFEAGSYQDGIVALNVVPERATATVDMRIPPDMKIEDVLKCLHTKLEAFPAITLHVEAKGEERTTQTAYDTTLYKALAECIKEQGLEPIPLIFEGASDLRFYLKEGIEGIGFSPFTTKDLLHSINESISIADMVRGKEIFIRLLQRMCMHKEY